MSSLAGLIPPIHTVIRTDDVKAFPHLSSWVHILPPDLAAIPRKPHKCPTRYQKVSRDVGIRAPMAVHQMLYNSLYHRLGRIVGRILGYALFAARNGSRRWLLHFVLCTNGRNAASQVH
jgi:hypothetical protein